MTFGRITLRSSSSFRRGLVYVHRCCGRTCCTLFYSDAGDGGFCLRRRFVSQRLGDITSQKTVVYGNKSDKIYRGILEIFRICLSRNVKREKTNKMQQLDVYYQLLSQHVSGIIMPIFRRTKTVLLHMVYCSGSAGCGW